MARYFLDTSALIKRYVNDEPGHEWISSICAAEAGHAIMIAEVALVEMVATFCRMAREIPPRLQVSDRDSLIALFREHDIVQTYTIIIVQRGLIERAATLCLTYPLRAYDAMQLACALQAGDDAAAAGVSQPFFVCADLTLLAAAKAEGLAVENPNQHI